MVPVLSSLARMPFPVCVMKFAVAINSCAYSVDMLCSFLMKEKDVSSCRR